MSRSIGPTLRKQWSMLANRPFGKWLFSRLVGIKAPYTGTIGATVELLENGHGIVSLADRARVRNHLGSIHAIALVNLAEMVTGLTLMYSLPDGMRGILVEINMQYHKKARGRLRAECFCAPPATGGEETIKVTGEIRDADGEVVASAVASWLIGPEKT